MKLVDIWSTILAPGFLQLEAKLEPHKNLLVPEILHTPCQQLPMAIQKDER